MHPPPALWGLQLVSGTGLGSPNQCIQWRRFHDGPCDKGRYREGCTLVYSSVAIYCKACGAFGCSTPSKCYMPRPVVLTQALGWLRPQNGHRLCMTSG